MQTASHDRVDWVDYAKGFCIVMVVMMHSTLGVEAAAGRESWMHALVAFAKPFRMPDFFLISGLFLSRRIAAPWRSYVDRKVVHFAYFYLLWMTLQLMVRGPAIAADDGPAAVFTTWLDALIDPFGGSSIYWRCSFSSPGSCAPFTRSWSGSPPPCSNRPTSRPAIW